MFWFPLFPVVFFGVVVGIIVISIVVAHKVEKNRTERLARVASEMGFSFQPDGKTLLASGISTLPLFNRGHSKKAKNVLEKVVRGNRVNLLDYQYTVGGGKSSHTHRHTLAVFQTHGEAAFPDFEMCPENFLHRIGALFGYQDIDFETHPTFSKKYLVRGKNEQAIRAAFTVEALDHFENQSVYWYVEARSGWLAVYKSGRVEPDAIRSFLADATKAFLFFAPTSDAGEDSQVSEPDAEVDPLGE